MVQIYQPAKKPTSARRVCEGCSCLDQSDLKSQDQKGMWRKVSTVRHVNLLIERQYSNNVKTSEETFQRSWNCNYKIRFNFQGPTNLPANSKAISSDWENRNQRYEKQCDGWQLIERSVLRWQGTQNDCCNAGLSLQCTVCADSLFLHRQSNYTTN